MDNYFGATFDRPSGTTSWEITTSSHVTLDLPPIKRLRVEHERREQFMLMQGLSLGSKVLGRLEEVVVEPGDIVSVVGLMMLDPASEPAEGELGFRDAGPPELRLTGNVEHPIVIGTPVDPPPGG